MSGAADRPTIADERLQALIDDELAPDRQAAAERRLATDAAAAARRHDYAAQKRLLSEALAAAVTGPEDPYTAALADGLARRLVPPRLRWLRGLGIAATLLAAGWLGHAALAPRPGGQVVPELVADAAQVHELFAEDPKHAVELTPAESGEIAAWMTRELGEYVAVPDLRGMQLTFLGGRLLGSEEGPFAQLLYEAADGARVSLSVSRPTAEEHENLQLVEVDGLNAGYWQDDELAYAIVAELSTNRLRSIASSLGADPGRL